MYCNNNLKIYKLNISQLKMQEIHLLQLLWLNEFTDRCPLSNLIYLQYTTDLNAINNHSLSRPSCPNRLYRGPVLTQPPELGYRQEMNKSLFILGNIQRSPPWDINPDEVATWPPPPKIDLPGQ